MKLASEFNPLSDYRLVFTDNNLSVGRMIGSSKSGYLDSHRDNLVVFNANIVTESSSKVWYGDLDITLDFDNLKNIADFIKEDLYVLREMDSRFENDEKPFSFYKTKAISVIKTNYGNKTK